MQLYIMKYFINAQSNVGTKGLKHDKCPYPKLCQVQYLYLVSLSCLDLEAKEFKSNRKTNRKGIIIQSKYAGN